MLQTGNAECYFGYFGNQKQKYEIRDYILVIKGCGLVLGIFFFFFWAFFFWSVGFVPAFFPAHVVWLGGVFVVVWWSGGVFVVFLWCFCGGVFVVVFVW